jgi:hypothetical protein
MSLWYAWFITGSEGIIMKFVLSVLVVFMTGVQGVQAACQKDTEVEMGVYTQHLSGDRSKYNEFNEFLGVSVNCWQFAKFLNSHHDEVEFDGNSVAIGYTIGSHYVSASLGVIHGYGEYAENFKTNRIGNTGLIWYFVPEVTVWDDYDLLPFSEYMTVGVRGRLFGDVVSITLVFR